MRSHYVHDLITNVWKRVGSDKFPYSDGDEVENRLLRIIEGAIDISTSSEELARAIVDWPTEYHLSTTRHNLLRPFAIGAEHKVLELGCGCGAMTRYLGETGATVVAVEGSMRRSQIAASRCRDLPNVTVYCDNLIDFSAPLEFDFVTLIGVLEYSPIFIQGPDPIDTCLRHARSMLNADGALVLAIENQLGLKYFNGCSEDHVSIPYYGINGLYKCHDPVTFGRYALAKILTEAGLLEHEFYFPFPDYKLPGLIVNEVALRERCLNLADLLIPHTGRCYPETHHRAFAEDLAWCSVIDNSLLADLANSFLVLARHSNATTPRTAWMAKMFSRGHRRPCYQIESSIEQTNDGTLIVRKSRVFPDAAGNASLWLRHAVSDSDYLPGKLCIARVHRAMAREAGMDELAACFAPWLNFLLSRTTTDSSGDYWLPGNFVDCIPANMIETNAGELHYFDAEWSSETPIPLSWIVIRGVIYSLSGCLENSMLLNETYRKFTTGIAKRNHINLSLANFTVADQLERQLVEECHADHHSIPRFSDFLDNPLFLTVRLAQHSTDYQRSLAWHQTELARVKRTVSWRITMPIRVTWNILISLVSKCRR